MKSNFLKTLLISASVFATNAYGQALSAADSTAAMALSAGAKPSGMDSYIPWVLLATAFALAIVILFMGSLLGRVAILKMKQSTKSIIAILTFSGSLHLMAATGTEPGSWSPSSFQLNMIIMSIIFLEVLVILYFANWLRAIVLPKKEVKEVVEKESTFSKWWYKINGSVEIEKEKDVQLDHDYDGIKELDNALPPWWLYGFYLTVVFAGIYIWRYHISKTAPLQVQELNIALAEAKLQEAEFAKKQGEKVDENSIEYAADPQLIATGKAIFDKNCVACHGPDGGGISGPNLTDEYWKHGGSIKNIFKTIKYGVLDKGMIAWGEVLTAKDMAAAATYIKSLKGSTPKNPLPPYGDLYSEDGAATAADSTVAPNSNTTQETPKSNP